MKRSEGSTTAGKLKMYQEETEAELERILDFWIQQAPDVQHGGFVGQMDNNGTVNLDASKGGVLNARILWTFSAAFRHTANEGYRSMAARAYDFMMKHFRDTTYGGVYWAVDAEGLALNTRKQIYAQAFAIYGLSEYYSATKEAEALNGCIELFRWIEQYSFDAESGGYLEAFSREGKLLQDLRLSEKDRNDPKTMNTHLHILEAYANLYRVWPDKDLARQLESLIEVFLEHIVDPVTKHMNLFFSRDWRVTTQLVSYGHDIEASWLLQEAAGVLGKEELLEKVRKLAVEMAEATEEGLQPDGSLYHEFHRDKNHYDKHREWWVSAEAMVGYLNAYQVSKDEAYLEKSLNSWEFAKKHLLDRKNGEWFWGVWDDYSLMASEDKVGFWKCPYHNTRACMEVISRCKYL